MAKKVTDKDMEKYISGGGKMFKFRDPRNGEVTEFIDNASNRGKVKRIVQRYISIRGDGTHQDYLKKKAGTAEKVGAVALFAIPGGGLIRLGTMGTKAAANALKAARAKYPKGKVVSKPTPTQIRNAKPLSASGVKPGSGGPASRGGRRGNRTSGSVPAGGSSTKPTPKPKPTTISQVKPKVRVPAVTRGGASSKRMPPRRPGLAKNRKRVDGKPIETPSTPKVSGRPMSTRQMRDKVKANEAKRTLPPKPLTAAQRAALAGRSAVPAIKVGTSDTSKATKPKVTRSGAASKRMPTLKKRTAPNIASEAGRRGTPKRAGKPRTAPNIVSEAGRSGTPKRTPKPRVGDTSLGRVKTKVGDTSLGRVTTAGRKGTPKPRTAPSTASEAGRKGTPKRTTKITAGPNVGFGPKGNQFPKDAADRRRLMAKYGGTGSAAARAAARGTQGNLKKGKK